MYGPEQLGPYFLPDLGSINKNLEISFAFAFILIFHEERFLLNDVYLPR